MEIFQNRHKRKRMFLTSLLLAILFAGIALFILSALLGLIDVNPSRSHLVKNNNWILIIPLIFFGAIFVISFMSLRIHQKFLKVEEALLTITNEGICVFSLPNKQNFTPWDQVDKIEYRRFGRTSVIQIKDKEKILIANIPVQMMDRTPEDVLSEIQKHKLVNTY